MKLRERFKKRDPATHSVLLCAALLLSTYSSMSAAGDEHWDKTFGEPGTSNTVYGFALKNGKLYSGGVPILSSTNTFINVWDGTRWSNLGRFSSSLPYVYEIAFLGDVLFAGGSFTNVDGVAVNGLAQWNGTSWSSVGAFKGFPATMVADSGKLYVGGTFTNDIGGGIVMTNIGYWDGTAWHALGAGLGKSSDMVWSIAVTNGTVYAGGAFTNSGSTAVTNFARWNGSSWVVVGAAPNNVVRGIAFKDSDIYVSGAFTQIGALSANYAARWDGANWFALGAGLNNTAYRVTVFGNLVCFSGTFTSAGIVTANRFATWDGLNWAAAGSGLSGDSYRVISTASNVYVGGNFSQAAGQIANFVGRWDGSTWSVIGPRGETNGVNSTVRAFARDSSNLYVGGNFTTAGNVTANRIARWDGTNWYPLGSGMNNTVSALLLKNGQLYAGGVFTTAGGTSASHIARWDGLNWYSLGSGVPTNVNAMAIYGNDLIAGGNFQFNAADGPANCLARWDGTNWWMFGGYSISAPATGNGVSALAVQGSDVYIGGQFRASGYLGASCTNIIRFDGYDFQAMANGVNSNVNAIAIIGNNVYVGGLFTNASGLAVSRVAMWNGFSWSNVGGGLRGTGNFSVAGLTAVGNNIYACGSFTNAAPGALIVNRVAKWDGANWSALGTAITPAPLSSAVSLVTIQAFGSDVYAGGLFGMAGGKPSFNIAHWNETRNFDGGGPALQISNPVKAMSNPFSFSVNASNVSSYIIEATTNLSVWSPLQTNSASPYQFFDSNSVIFPNRAYRLRVGP